MKRACKFDVPPDEAALYLDFYGGLLTAKQAQIIDYHYNEDYSLSEISEALGISRQAAHESLKNGMLALLGYEEKLGLARAHANRQSGKGEALKSISELRAAVEKLRLAGAGGPGVASGAGAQGGGAGEGGIGAAYAASADEIESAALKVEEALLHGYGIDE